VARQASEINPDDQFKDTNLGGGDPWGRQVMDRMIALEKEALIGRASRSGFNRGDAASRANLSGLINSVISPAADVASGSNFSIPAGQINSVPQASIKFVVPAGYTKALVTATAQAYGYNSTAANDYLYSYVTITGGWTTWSSGGTVPAGFGSPAVTIASGLVTGKVAGDLIWVTSQPYTAVAGWATNTSNSTVIAATCLFLH